LTKNTQYFSAVIMVIDAVSYSKHMEVNPDATLRAVQSAEDFIENRLKHIDGNIFNKAGDSLLLIFKNPEDALKVAIDFQLYNVTKNSSDENEINVEFRLGINIGEVTQSGSDYLGDGVNIAARLETLSQPNGICISKSFYEKIKHGPEVRFKNLGNKKVKENKFIAFDIITPWYQKRKIQTESFTIISFIAIAVVILITATFFGNIHSLFQKDGKIRLAILPFDVSEISADQSYLASSMQEDLIVDLAKIDEILVLASNSTAQFENGFQEREEIFKLLKPSYMLVTKARNLGTSIKISSQLIDADGNIKWAENYSSEVTKIDNIQSKLELDLLDGLGVQSASIQETLEDSVVTINPEAYDLFKRARVSQDRAIARKLYRKAISISPNFAAAHSSLAINMSYGFVGVDRSSMGSMEFDIFKMEALNHARTAVKITPNDPFSHYGVAFVHYQAAELDDALAAASKAIALNEDNPQSLLILGAIEFGLEQYEKVLQVADKLKIIDPINSANGLIFEASAHFGLQNYEAALKLSEKANERDPNYARGQIIMLASNWKLGNTDEAIWQYEELTLSRNGTDLDQLLRTLPWPSKFKATLAKIFSDIDANSQ